MTTNPDPFMKNRALSGRTVRRDTRRSVHCQICGAKTTPGLDLCMQPVGDLILSKSQLNRPESYYPMQMHHCVECGLTQLGYIVNPSVVYRNFPFVSGTTQTATKHLQSLPQKLVPMLGLTNKSFAVDIGSNDGTLLKAYVPFGVPFLGVDPSGDPVAIARAQGIETMHAFFNEDTANQIVVTRGKADAITACGVFAHIADIHSVMRGVKALLAKKGVFANDSQYWLDMVQRLHYDNAFHQHLRYYSMRPLIELFRRYDLEVFDVERSDTYGGQIRSFACHRSEYPISTRVTDLLKEENDAKLYEPATHERYARDAEVKRRSLFEKVYGLVKEGRKVIGIGAPAKASTVCNYCRLGPDLISYIAEVNPLRMGMYLPGVRVPIVDEELVFSDPDPADAAVLFAWNFHDEIVPKLRRRGFKGEIILP
jgi:C-methyltransferase C-terminal domain/Methyltransferase domain/Putative zinc binding domain